MLIPYALRRFNAQARRPAAGALRHLEMRSKLLFLLQGGRRLAGAVVVCNGDQLWIAVFGVKDGDLTLMRDGAIAGLYALTIEWAKHIGMRDIHAGRTSVFESDGLIHYKRKWGMSPVREPLSHLIAMRVDRSHEALKLALEREPFWIESEPDGLELYPGPRVNARGNHGR
jgi:hypothetical protein